MKNISKKAFREKQERIAQELGLIDKPIAMSITRPLPPGYEKRWKSPYRNSLLSYAVRIAREERIRWTMEGGASITGSGHTESVLG